MPRRVTGNAARKGGRATSGGVSWAPNSRTGAWQWHARITTPDGKRTLVPIDPSIPESDVDRAKTGAARLLAHAGNAERT